MWPFAMAGLGLRYLVMPLAVRFGHPLRNGYLWATQRLVGKLYAVGFSVDGVGEEAHLIQRRVFLVTSLLFPHSCRHGH